MNADKAKLTALKTVIELELSHLQTLRLADSPEIRIAVAEREQVVAAELEQVRKSLASMTAAVAVAA